MDKNMKIVWVILYILTGIGAVGLLWSSTISQLMMMSFGGITVQMITGLAAAAVAVMGLSNVGKGK